MVQAPCKGCTYRHIGYHSECEAYQDFVEEHKKEKEERRAQKAIDGTLAGLHIARALSIKQRPTRNLISHRRQP